MQRKLKTVYHNLFDEAVEKYNAKQTRADRKVDNYYEKIRTSKQEKLFHELIIQVGNKDDMNARSENGQLAKEILTDYMQGFQEREKELKTLDKQLEDKKDILSDIEESEKDTRKKIPNLDEPQWQLPPPSSFMSARNYH